MQTTDRLFEALANKHRRQILFSLRDGALSISLDSPPDGIDEPRAGFIEQRHTHLPKLADYGFIRWDPGTNTVERGSQFEEIKPVLELLDESRE